MQTKIVIRDFERTENLEDYLQGKIEDSIYPFLQQFPDSQVQVTVNEDRRRSSTRKPHFECTVLSSMPGRDFSHSFILSTLSRIGTSRIAL